MGEKKEKASGAVTVVLKADFHCEGCASKIIKSIRSFDGVDAVTIDGQKITVVGMVDPAKLREKVEHRSHNKVELVSPQIKKDGDKKENDGGGDKKKESKDDKSDQKKPKEKEPPVTTAVLKLNLHCDGCIQKMYKIITKTKGYKDMKIDHQKDLVTVTGAMDMKALAEVIQKQLKKQVTIVPPKKDGDKKDGGGGGGGGKGNTGDDGDGGSGDEKKKKQPPIGYLYPFMYEPVAVNLGEITHYNQHPAQYHAPQIFSDENPNSCTVM